MFVNVIKVIFALMALGILCISLIFNFFEPRLPTIIKRGFRYGKFSYNKSSVVQHLEVPKSWFRHFYVVAIVYCTGVLLFTAAVYTNVCSMPEFVPRALDFVGGHPRKAAIDGTTALLTLTLFYAQVWKRLYETFYVSVFSDSKINITHYFIGIFHYIGAVTAIIVESPAYATSSYVRKATLSLSDVGYVDVIGTVVFLWAWYHQYQSAVILANLRKDGNGKVVNYEHKIPRGGLFEYVSSPHLFCEMMMYLALSLMLWNNSTWPYVFVWVLCNQFETALLSHWWYRSKFESYPAQRKAFIPFVI